MAWQFQNNLTPATGAVAAYAVKTAMKAAGWTVPKSSDGTTYNSSGDQISSGAAGAGGWGNNFAWAVLQMPGGSGRQVCIQKSNANNTDWRITYSKSAGFVTGAPSATVVPTASDSHTLLGSGSDGAPGFAAWFGGADGTYRYSAAANDASPYGVFAFAFIIGGGPASHAWLIDPMDPALSANFNSYETDPYVFFASAVGDTWGSSMSTTFRGFVNGVWLTAINILSLPFRLSQSPLLVDPGTGKDVGNWAPIYYQVANFLKGFGTVWKFHLTGPAAARPTPTPIQLVTLNDTIIISDVEFPWDGSAPVI